MDVEAKLAFASRNVEIEAAVAEVQVPRLVEGVVNRPEDLPIDMRADPEAADIAISGQPETVAEVAVIARTDQRIGPATAGVHAHTGKQTRVERYSRRKSPSAEPKAGIGKLQRVLDHAVESHPRAGIHPQRGIAALIKDVVRRDVGAHRQVDRVDEETELPVTGFCRPHERRPIEMGQ